MACALLSPDAATSEAQWRKAIARAEREGPLGALVHAVPPPAELHADFTRFMGEHEAVLGSLWLGATLCAEAMQSGSGGAIVVIAARDEADPTANMFGDGLRALASSFGVAWAEGDAPVRVDTISLTADVLRGKGESDLISRAAALAGFMASPGASYITATEVRIA